MLKEKGVTTYKKIAIKKGGSQRIKKRDPNNIKKGLMKATQEEKTAVTALSHKDLKKGTKANNSPTKRKISTRKALNAMNMAEITV